MPTKKRIALDCDGVLLNYIDCYQKLYEELFKEKLTIANPKSYSADTHLGINWDGREKERKHFYEYFHDEGWLRMTPLHGAVEATQKLKNAGYEIFVVTSIPEDKDKDRAINLTQQGIIFDDVIACGSHSSSNGFNIKKPHLDKLKPEYFVDDLISNFHGVSDDLKCVFIDWHCENNDDWKDTSEPLIKIYSHHEKLLDFVNNHI